MLPHHIHHIQTMSLLKTGSFRSSLMVSQCVSRPPKMVILLLLVYPLVDQCLLHLHPPHKPTHLYP